MKFINRKAELAELNELETLSRKKLFVVAIYGLRRVGKTRLLLEFLKNRGIYFFVNKNKTSSDLLSEFQGILKKKQMLGELESLASWDDFFSVLMRKETPPIVFDEFQNFRAVEPAVFGIFQKNIDLNENKPGLFILSGSLIGLMKEMFKNSSEPLYGRIKKGRKLEPLALSSCLEIGKELNLSKEDLLKSYIVFGGYPKYYVALEDFNLQGKSAEEIIEALFLSRDAPLEDEVSGILSQEFGGRSGVYYSILEAIANGNNSLSSIAGYVGAPATSITRQLNELRDHFELIELEMPYSGKRGLYRIKHPLIEFWFSQVYKNFSEYAARRPEFIAAAKKGLNVFYGRGFEKAAKEFLAGKLGLSNAHRQWGRIEGAKKGENTYEIDLIAENKETFLFEFKWKDLTYHESVSVLESLNKKAGYVPRLPKNFRLGIVARKMKEKQKLRDAGYLAYDLEDF